MVANAPVLSVALPHLNIAHSELNRREKTKLIGGRALGNTVIYPSVCPMLLGQKRCVLGQCLL